MGAHLSEPKKVSERSGGSSAGWGKATHQLLLRIIGISVSLLDQLNTEDVELVEVVGGVGGGIGLDAEEGQVLDDGGLELGLHE